MIARARPSGSHLIDEETKLKAIAQLPRIASRLNKKAVRK
jgi:hypothetical protein